MSDPVSVSGPDIETLLAAHVYGVGPVLGGHPMICSCGAVSTSGGDEPLQTAHRAHVAAVLREQIAVAMLDAWDRGWAARAQSRHGRYSFDHLDDPYRAALAAQIAPLIRTENAQASNATGTHDEPHA